MDSVFGFVGNGFVIVAADASATRSIIVFKNDHDKVIWGINCWQYPMVLLFFIAL